MSQHNAGEDSAADHSHPHQHKAIPGAFEELAEDLNSGKTLQADMLKNAIGGWRGVLDSSVPTVVFLIAYLVGGKNLQHAIWAAVIAGGLIAVWRLVRRQSIQQVLSGFGAVALSAWIASRTGSAVNFFLPGLLINIAWAVVFALSALFRWPAVGVFLGGMTGDLSTWRTKPNLMRAFTAATWIFTATYLLRVMIQAPLYFAEMVGPLGVVKLATGWPLTLVAFWLSYRLIKPVWGELTGSSDSGEPADTANPDTSTS